MEQAKAMAWGGEKVDACDVTYHDYKYLGLRCCYCGEPVYLKAGFINKPHFAHFPDISPEKKEECVLRQKNIGFSIGSGYGKQGYYQNRGQRLKLFQENFIKIILRDIEEEIDFQKCMELLERKIKLVKDSYYSYELEINKENIKNIFCKTQRKISILRVANNKRYSYPKNKWNIRNLEIAREAVDYLGARSSSRILEDLMYYGVYNFEHETQLPDNFSNFKLLCNNRFYPVQEKNGRLIHAIHDYFVLLLGRIDYEKSFSRLF